MKRLLILALCLSLVACGGNIGLVCPPSQTCTAPAPPRTSAMIVADSIGSLADSVAAIQTAAINANTQKLITDQQTGDILKVTTRVLLATKEVNTVTLGLVKLSQANKQTLLGIFDPIIKAVDSSLASGLISIKDPKTLDTIRFGLLAIQTTLRGVNSALQGSN